MNDTVIKLKCPVGQLNRQRIRDAELVIDERNVVIKDRFGSTPRPATPTEIERATEVFG